MAQGGVRAEPQPPVGNVRLDRYPTLTGNGHFSQTWQWFYIQWGGTYKSHTGEVERGPCRSWATLLTPVVVEIVGGAFQAACRHSTGSHPTLGWSLKKVLHAYDLWPWVLNPGAWETWDLKSETRYIPAGGCTFVSNSFSRMSLLDPGALLPDFISCCWREGPQRAWNILAWLQTIKTWFLSHLGRSTPLAQFRAQSSSFLVAGSRTLYSIWIFIGSTLREEKHRRLNLQPGVLLLHFKDHQMNTAEYKAGLFSWPRLSTLTYFFCLLRKVPWSFNQPRSE